MPPAPIGSESLVDLGVAFTNRTPAPRVFRTWSWIQAVGAAAERRVWSHVNELILYPNLYIFLVGPPGTGKTAAIAPCAAVLRKSQVVHLAPKDVTKQGLLDALIKCTKGGLTPEGRPFDYTYMTMYISELSNFMSQYDGVLAGILTELFDCDDVYDEQKRGVGKDAKVIPFPGLSFIMGTATQNLGETISDAMWGSGFMARVILVYSAEAIKPKSARAMFAKRKVDDNAEQDMLAAFRRIGELKGEMVWEDEAQDFIWRFWTSPWIEPPLHNRLVHYNTRRWMHLAKLCMIAALSDERMVVLKEDCDTALTWLLSAEADMPEIFKDMVSHADGQIYEELRSAMYGVWINTGRCPIHTSAIYAFLASRTSSIAVERVFQIAIAADLFRRVAGEEDQWIPQPPKGSKNRGVL